MFYRKLLKKIGFKKNKPLVNKNGRPRLNIDLQDIVDLKNKGLNNSEIARKLKVSESTIRNRLK